MPKSLRKPRMGLLLFGAQRFCVLGEGTARGSYLQRKNEEAQQMAADCAILADVTFPSIVFGHQDVIYAMDAFVRDRVDYVLAIYLSWAEDFAWVRFLRDMPPAPILFAHRMRDSIDLSDTHDEDEFTEYLCCGGLVGSLEASSHAVNLKRPMLQTIVGTWTQILERCEVFGNAARARALLRESKMGLLACYNEAMWSTYVHPYDVFTKVGPELHFLSIAELEDAVNDIPYKEAELIRQGIAAQYEVLPNVGMESFLASIRASVALERLAEKHNLDLLVLNDIDTVLFQRIGLRPGFYPTSGHGEAVIVPEGDIGGGIAAYVLRLLTGGHVHFIEPFHINLPEECFAAGHAGPNDYSDPAGKTKISRDVRFAKSKWKYAGAPFAWHVFSQGCKTMLHCSQHEGKFLFAATLVDSLPCQHHLATYSHGLFRPLGQTVTQLFDGLLRLGVTQHYGLASGNVLPALSDLAQMMEFRWQQL